MSDQQKPVSLVILGLNFGAHIAEQLMDGVAGDSVALMGLCDQDREKLEQFSKTWPQLKTYDSLDAVLADESVEAVGLFTGPGGRAKLIRKIIQAGKDVMTTKPFESDPAEGRRILEEAASLNRVIHLNSPSPGLSPDLAVIRGWEESYQLGQPIAARAETWVRYHEKLTGGWYDDPNLCPVAPVFRLGIYLINDLVQLFGSVRAVQVSSTRLFTERPTVDNAQLALEFENGALGNIFASFCVNDGDHYRNSQTLNYENGTVYREVGPDRSSETGGDLALVMRTGEGDTRQIVERTHVKSVSGLYNWKGFAAAVRKEPDAPNYKVDDVIGPLKVICAMREAEQSGCRTEVKPG